MPSIGLPELIVLALIGLMFVGVLILVLRGLRVNRAAPPRDPALDELRTRLAAGEIDEAEFERLRSVLHRV
jgi:uncharacterized membrane protein